MRKKWARLKRPWKQKVTHSPKDEYIMQTVQFPIRNVTCEACEKVIGRLLRRFDHAKIESISKDATTLTLTCDEKDVEGIKEQLREYNYLNDDNSIGHFSYVLKKIISNAPGFRAEHELLTYTLSLFVILFAGLGLMYLGWFNQNTIFPQLWPILALVPLGIAVNSGALLHVHHLRHHFNCANGMMAGMIIGMISGFMSGALIGATNGMFAGSLTGMAVGMGASSYAVRKTGVMGVLDGLMAGLMAGTMGAMLSVMMISDNLIPFLYILFGVCTFILGGMSYFIVKEIGPIHDEQKRIELFPLALLGILVLMAIIALILFGPKSAIVFAGGAL